MRVRISIVLLGILAVATACGDDSPEAGSGTTTTGSTTDREGGEFDLAIDGREFVSSDVDGHELVEGSQIRLTFHPDYLDGSAGCNLVEFTWSLDATSWSSVSTGRPRWAASPRSWRRTTG
jgi:hypothetical protein